MDTMNSSCDRQVQHRFSLTKFFTCNGNVRSAESTPFMLRRRLVEVSGALVTCRLRRKNRSGSCHTANDGASHFRTLSSTPTPPYSIATSRENVTSTMDFKKDTENGNGDLHPMLPNKHTKLWPGFKRLSFNYKNGGNQQEDQNLGGSFRHSSTKINFRRHGKAFFSKTIDSAKNNNSLECETFVQKLGIDDSSENSAHKACEKPEKLLTVQNKCLNAPITNDNDLSTNFTLHQKSDIGTTDASSERQIVKKSSLKHNATNKIASLVNLTSAMAKTSPTHQPINNRQVGFSQYQEVIRVNNANSSRPPETNNNNEIDDTVVKGEYANFSLSKSESCSSTTLLQCNGTPLAPPPFPVLRQQTIDSIFSTASDSMKLDSSEDGECSTSKTYVLQIHLKEGKDLVIRDTSGTSDPYVKFKYKNKTIFKSTIIFKNLNPVWDERFSHVLDDLSLPLFVQLSKKHTTPDSASSKKTKAPHTWSYTVNIVLVEAKDLLPAESLHSISVVPPDTYVRFKLGVDKYKSKIVPKTSQPKWLEQFDMHMFDDQQSNLEITVFDKRKDCCIGKCNVNLSLLEREKTHHEWYDLFEYSNNNNNKGSSEVIVGKIFLLISISGQQSPVLSSPLSVNSEDSGSIDDSKFNLDQRLLKRRYSWMSSHEDVQDIGILTVKVFRAQGLTAADIGGKSDPFCVLELVNARVQTHTEYKTLSPEWNKAFYFNIRDINAVLEVTVFDEDPNKKVEFLGKIAVPLLRMISGEKKWFALKDRKLQRRAKGKIQLQFDLIWNPVRAAIRTVNPKERKYMYQEEKFKRQIFMRNAMRVKSIIMEVVDVGSFVQSCWSWESPARSVISFIVFLLATYFFELYMVPIVLLIFFIRGYMYRSVVESLKMKNTGLEEYYVDSDSDDDQTTVVDDKEEKLGIKQRLIAVQDTLTMVQNALDYIASTIERVKNTFNFAVPFLSLMAIGVLTFMTIVLYLLPLRLLVFIWGVNKFTKKLRSPNAVPNNELLDFLSRVPCDDEIRKYAEFRPDPLVGTPSSASNSATKKRKTP